MVLIRHAGGGAKSLGLGLLTAHLDVVVQELVPGMPAAECGKVSVGDYLRTIDGQDIGGLNKAEIDQLLVHAGRKVRLLVSRAPAHT